MMDNHASLLYHLQSSEKIIFYFGTIKSRITGKIMMNRARKMEEEGAEQGTWVELEQGWSLDALKCAVECA